MKTLLSKKRMILLISLAVVLVAAIAVTTVVLIISKDEILPPDYPPQSSDPNQIPIPDDEGGKLESPTGGGAVNITYSRDVTVSLSRKNATFYYANPSKSNQNVAIAIVVGDVVISKSALITPGNMVTALSLEEGVEKKLGIGGYDAELIVYCYHPETGEKAMVDTKAEITVNVVE
jgi:hypothetical protein